MNWSFPDQHSVEVLDGTKGKLDGYVVHNVTKLIPPDINTQFVKAFDTLVSVGKTSQSGTYITIWVSIHEIRPWLCGGILC